MLFLTPMLATTTLATALTSKHQNERVWTIQRIFYSVSISDMCFVVICFAPLLLISMIFLCFKLILVKLGDFEKFPLAWLIVILCWMTFEIIIVLWIQFAFRNCFICSIAVKCIWLVSWMHRFVLSKRVICPYLSIWIVSPFYIAARNQQTSVNSCYVVS